MKAIRKIGPDERVEGDPTPGMIREQAVATDRLWAGLVRNEPRAESGWHHHSDNETAVFILFGRLRFEFGPAGGDTVDASAGDFVYVPPEIVHREINPTDEESRFVVIRAVSGPPTVNVEGPEPA
ncbi:MAG TPA: cupin domain-containing protein [Actinomycetota bacterium]